VGLLCNFLEIFNTIYIMYFGCYMSESVSDMSVCFPEINNNSIVLQLD